MVVHVYSDHYDIPHIRNEPRFLWVTITLSTLEEENVFVSECQRKHETFNLKCGLLEKVSRKDLLKKVQTSIDQICLVK